MAWGIPGNVGEIYRKQQSDELRDQLLKQEMAQRIRAFEEQQQQNREEAEQRRITNERLGRQEERQTRLDTEAADTRAGQKRAIGNIQGLIPLLQPGTPEFRNEVAQQGLRIDPERAISELLKEPPPPKAKHWVQEAAPGGGFVNRAVSEEEGALGIPGYVPPREPREPRAINYVEYEDEQGNIREAPEGTARPGEKRRIGAGSGKRPATGQARRQLDFFISGKQADEELETVEEKIAGLGMAGQARLNAPDWLNFLQTPEGQTYNQARNNFIGAMTTGRSGAQVRPDEVYKMDRTFFAQPGNTKEVIAQKRRARAAALSGLAAQAGAAMDDYYGEDEATNLLNTYRTRAAGREGQPASPTQGGGAQPKVGDIKTFPNGKKGRFDGKGWELIQ